jgi:hypothetical protein
MLLGPTLPTILVIIPRPYPSLASATRNRIEVNPNHSPAEREREREREREKKNNENGPRGGDVYFLLPSRELESEQPMRRTSALSPCGAQRNELWGASPLFIMKGK